MKRPFKDLIYAFLEFAQENRRIILGTVSVILFLWFWETAVRIKWIDPLFTSSPSRIFAAASKMFISGELFKHLKVSAYEFSIGFAMAIIAGIPLGILLGWYKALDDIFNPFISALYATPRVAFLPLIIIWSGIGPNSKIILVFLGAIFPILINTVTAVRTIDASFIRLVRSFNGNDWDLFLTVAIPGSVPFIISGLRLGVGRGLIGIVVGEMYMATAGIGYFIAVMGQNFQTSELFVGVLIIAASGVIMMEVLRKLEHFFEPWRTSH